MIEEVLPLVPDECKDTLEALLRRTPSSDYNSRHFSTELVADLAIKLGRPPSVEVVDSIVSIVEKKLKVNEKLCKDLWWLACFIATCDQVCILFRVVVAFILLLN